MAMEDEIKRRTAKRKSALVLDGIQGKTTVAEASRTYDLPPSEIEECIDEGKGGMENALRANPQDVKEQFEQQLKELQGGLWGGDAGAACENKNAVPAGRERVVIGTIRQGLEEKGFSVSISQLCRWFGVALPFDT